MYELGGTFLFTGAMLAQVSGALLGCLFFSRIAIWIVPSRHRYKFPYLITAHGFTLLFSALMYATGIQEGDLSTRISMMGPYIPNGFALYTLPQAFWLIVEYQIRKQRYNRSINSSTEKKPTET